MLLRWAGVVVLYGATALARTVGDLDYSMAASNLLAPVVLAYNVVVWRLLQRWEESPPANWRRAYRTVGNVQCSLDLVVLAVVLHYVGGIESWGVIQPIAVLVVAALVLNEVDGLLQGLFACVLVDAVVLAEAVGWLPHVETGVIDPGLVTSARFVASFVVVYDIVVLFIVALVVYLGRGLRQREEEVARLYGREHETVRRLEEVDRLKSDFLATVSHELRTPLTAIIGFAKHLDRFWDRTNDTVRREQVSAIERQSQRLQRLVEDLLDFSAIEARNLAVHVVDFDLRPVLEGTLAQCGVEGVALDVPDGLAVHADPHRVEQVVVNLVDNAAKYGRPPLRVAAHQSDGHVVVSVSDDGEGIPPAAIERAFTRFMQLDHGPTRVGAGVGLGLSLVKGYVEALGGEVWYEPGQPRGARFCFTLARAGTNNGES